MMNEYDPSGIARAGIITAKPVFSSYTPVCQYLLASFFGSSAGYALWMILFVFILFQVCKF